MEIAIVIVQKNTGSDPAVSNTGTVWSDIEHVNAGSIIYVNTEEKSKQKEIASFVSNAKIAILPTVLFVEIIEKKQTIITRLEGNEQSYDKIKNRYLLALNGGYTDNVITGNNPDGENLPIGNSDALNLGLGGLGNGITLPKFIWGLFAIFGGYKTATVENNIGKILYGSGTAYSSYKYLK